MGLNDDHLSSTFFFVCDVNWNFKTNKHLFRSIFLTNVTFVFYSISFSPLISLTGVQNCFFFEVYTKKKENKNSYVRISQIDMTYFTPKSEEEYKVYLDNLLIEYQFACFSEKLGDGMLKIIRIDFLLKIP
jgi:hypothetical protein